VRRLTIAPLMLLHRYFPTLLLGQTMSIVSFALLRSSSLDSTPWPFIVAGRHQVLGRVVADRFRSGFGGTYALTSLLMPCSPSSPVENGRHADGARVVA